MNININSLSFSTKFPDQWGDSYRSHIFPSTPVGVRDVQPCVRVKKCISLWANRNLAIMVVSQEELLKHSICLLRVYNMHSYLHMRVEVSLLYLLIEKRSRCPTNVFFNVKFTLFEGL